MYPFATEAMAMAPGAGGGNASTFMQFVPFVVIFAIFYMLVIRPQQRKSKAHKSVLANLNKGDEVWTDGGIMGTIQKIAEDSVTLEIAPKVSIRILRARIADVVKAAKVVESKSAGKSKDGKSDDD